MGKKNYLIEGVSGTGKTTVCRALLARGFQAINGDTELAYRGDPATGEPIADRPDAELPWYHQHWIWDVEKVSTLVADHSSDVTFFCGASRNFDKFLHLFDAVFVLEVDVDTLHHRLRNREDDEPGKTEDERAFIERLHQTKEDLPKDAITIDARQSIDSVLSDILVKTEL